jgi:translation initiation factor IF-3
MLPASAIFASGTVPSASTSQRGDLIATDETRTNDRIRAREVLLIAEDGEQLGVKPLPEALTIARERELDLVEVAPNANPPVCRIMDFRRHQYEEQQRRKESRRKATQVVIKEMKFRPKIDIHDYTTKMRHVERFLAEGNKVKLTIMFRGREMAHPELGRKILDRVAEDVSDIAIVESAPKQDGRNMTMVLHPTNKGKSKPKASGGTKSRAPRGSAPTADEAADASTEDATTEAEGDEVPAPEPVAATTEESGAA